MLGIRKTISLLSKNTPSSNANHTKALFQKEFPEEKNYLLKLSIKTEFTEDRQH